MGFFRSCSPLRGRVSAAQGKEWVAGRGSEPFPPASTYTLLPKWPVKALPQPQPKDRNTWGPTLAALLPALQSSCSWWRKGPCRAGFLVAQFCLFPAAH